jgi:hypothetical protein
MNKFKACLGAAGFISLLGAPTMVAGQAKNQLTPPTVSANGEITGFSPAQASIVRKKISTSNSGSPCGLYLRKRGWSDGLNNAGERNEFTVSIGLAPVSAKISSPGYVDSRYVAFREAWLVANGAMARALESQVSSNASRTLRTGRAEKEQASPDQQAKTYRKQAANIKAQQSANEADGEGLISKGSRLLNALMDGELKSLGHDPDAEKKAAQEQNQVRKKALLAKAAKAEEEAKRLTGQRKFKEVIQAVAQEKMKGIYSAFTSENLSPDADANSQICVVLKYSPRSERMADMMASRDFSNAPELDPDIPLLEQLPDPATPAGTFQLVTMWGLNILFDENGQVNLVAFGQAGYANGDENLQLAAKEEAKLRAEGLIRLFINQTMAVKQASKTSQDVKSYVDGVKKTKLSKNLMSKMEQGGGFLPINGLKQVIDWNSVHPVTNGGVVGSVVSWNASEAAGAIASKARQNKVVKDRGGVRASPRNDRGAKSLKRRRGGLRGSTRSRDF